MTRTTPTRRGFTLVELLVAIALGIVLLGIAVGVSQSSAFESYKVVGAADRVSQWMLTAKNRALRDRAPRGVRLLRDPVNVNLVKEIAYIEQPEPWVPPAGVTLTLLYKTDAGTPKKVISRQAYLSGITPAALDDFVNGGDHLYIPDLNWSARLRKETTTNPSPFTPPAAPPSDPTGATVGVEIHFDTVNTPPASPDPSLPDLGAAHSPDPGTGPFLGTYRTTQFAFLRQPRPLLGEPTQLLTSGMAIDLDNSLPDAASPPATNDPIDILFAPSGSVIGNADGITALLLRDVNLPNVTDPLTAAGYPTAGQMILVCLYGRTGAISTQPVNPPPAVPPVPPAPQYDPYQFAKDGINTGL